MNPLHLAWTCFKRLIRASLLTGIVAAVILLAAPGRTFAQYNVLGPSNMFDTVSQANSALAVDLYQRLKEDKSSAGKNFFLSPFSISIGLTMTVPAASGRTAEQIRNVLHLPENRQPNDINAPLGMEQIHAAMNFFQSGLGAAPSQLYMTNTIWTDKTLPLRSEFTNVMQRFFGRSSLIPVNFSGDAEGVRNHINAAMEEQTAQKIKQLIPPGSVDRDTRFVLTNAVYFKGAWVHPFAKNATTDEPFHLDARRQVKVPMMDGIATEGYFSNARLSVLSIDYQTDRRAPAALSMLILLPPKPDGLPELEKQLSAANMRTWYLSRQVQPVHIMLPKFKITSEFSLKDVLTDLGMPLAFSENADFTNVSARASQQQLHLTEVLHKAYVEVNEEGTEAAAATAIGGGGFGGRGPQIASFQADHPFLFLIVQNPTGNILFMGRVMNPVE